MPPAISTRSQVRQSGTQQAKSKLGFALLYLTYSSFELAVLTARR